MAEFTRKALYELIEFAEAELAKLDEEILTPVKSEPVPDPDGSIAFALKWGGKGPENFPQIHTFEDGTVFQPYPVGLARDWDVIRRGQKDATGEYWRKYNNGNPGWNALDWDRAAPEEVKMQRLRDYAGGLRRPIDDWPDAYRKAYNETH